MKAKAARPRLLNHRTVARLVDVPTGTLLDWIGKGVWPEPHAIVERTWFFVADQVEAWLATGTWPPGTRFRAGVGRGRGEDA
jgi:hypothetical protein